MDIQRFKNRLEEELSLVQEELSSIGRKNPDNINDWEASVDMGDDSADENEVADKIEEYEENSAVIAELEERLNDIKLALNKIQDGSYGACEVCSEPIEEDRLYANPSSKTCKIHME